MTTDDTERRRLYGEACLLARDVGLKFVEKIPVDDAAGALIAAGSSMMAAAMSASIAANYLRAVAKQLEEAAPRTELN